MEHKDERGVEAREIRGDELAEIQAALAEAPVPELTDADLEDWYATLADTCSRPDCPVCGGA